MKRKPNPNVSTYQNTLWIYINCRKYSQNGYTFATVYNSKSVISFKEKFRERLRNNSIKKEMLDIWLMADKILEVFSK